jgi:hypothetical protein
VVGSSIVDAEMLTGVELETIVGFVPVGLAVISKIKLFPFPDFLTFP